MKTESAICVKTCEHIYFQGEERPSEKGEKQLELGPMSGESKLIVPAFSDFSSCPPCPPAAAPACRPLTPRLGPSPSKLTRLTRLGQQINMTNKTRPANKAAA